MKIYKPSYVFLCLFTISNYYSARIYFGIDLHIPLILSSLALVCHVVESISSNSKIFKINTPAVYILLTLLLFANATFMISYDSSRSFIVFEDFYKAVILYFLLANIIKSRQQFHGYLLLLTGCTFFLAYRVLNYGVWEQKRVFIYGSQLVTTDPNYLALVLAYSLPLIISAYYALEKRKNIVIIFIFLFIILRVIQGFVITESRGGFLGILVGAFVAFYILKGVNRKIMVAVIAIPIMLVVFIRYVPITYYYRMQEIIYPEADPTGSALVRAQSMKTAFQYLIVHPISEYGLGNHSYLLKDEFDADDLYEEGDIFRGRLMAHSFLLQIGADTGFVPLFFYFGFIVCLVIRLRRVSIFTPHDEEQGRIVFFANALIVSFAIVCAGGFFLPMGYKPFLFYIGGLADSLYSIYLTQRGGLENEETALEGGEKPVLT